MSGNEIAFLIVIFLIFTYWTLENWINRKYPKD